MNQEEINRLSELWPLWLECQKKLNHQCEACGTRIYGVPFSYKDEFNALVRKCCSNGHRYPDGTSAVTYSNMYCCKICGWDQNV